MRVVPTRRDREQLAIPSFLLIMAAFVWLGSWLFWPLLFVSTPLLWWAAAHRRGVSRHVRRRHEEAALLASSRLWRRR